MKCFYGEVIFSPSPVLRRLRIKADMFSNFLAWTLIILLGLRAFKNFTTPCFLQTSIGPNSLFKLRERLTLLVQWTEDVKWITAPQSTLGLFFLYLSHYPIEQPIILLLSWKLETSFLKKPHELPGGELALVRGVPLQAKPLFSWYLKVHPLLTQK